MEINPYPQRGVIKIGNDVWIGHNATIMAGVTSGDGAIISTNSTIVNDIEPYSIVCGILAEEIKKRFPEDVVAKLLELKCWDWEIEKITKNMQNLTGNEIDNLNI
jgi:virginiamycin A acetyltransferase